MVDDGCAFDEQVRPCKLCELVCGGRATAAKTTDSAEAVAFQLRGFFQAFGRGEIGFEIAGEDDSLIERPVRSADHEEIVLRRGGSLVRRVTGRDAAGCCRGCVRIFTSREGAFGRFMSLARDYSSALIRWFHGTLYRGCYNSWLSLKQCAFVNRAIVVHDADGIAVLL